MILVIAGIFAFLPVEKASTVHGNLATPSTVQAIDRGIFVSFNQSLTHAQQFGGGTLLDVDSGTTSGRIVMSAIPNQCNGCGAVIECGLRDAGGTNLATNATGGNPSTATFTITDGDDILGGVDTASSTIGGVCEFTIIIDTGNS